MLLSEAAGRMALSRLSRIAAMSSPFRETLRQRYTPTARNSSKPTHLPPSAARGGERRTREYGTGSSFCSMKRAARGSFGCDGAVVTSIRGRRRSNSHTRSRLSAEVIRTQCAGIGRGFSPCTIRLSPTFSSLYHAQPLRGDWCGSPPSRDRCVSSGVLGVKVAKPHRRNKAFRRALTICHYARCMTNPRQGFPTPQQEVSHVCPTQADARYRGTGAPG